MGTRAIVWAGLIGLVAVPAVFAQEQGTAIGKVITVGEDRLVVAVHDQGEMTFEVQQVRDGDKTVPNGAQVAQIKTIKKDQMVRVKWVRAHDGHYYIQELAAGPECGARQGLLTGAVITAGEGRVVVAKDGGGQVTLESAWLRRDGKWDRDPWQDLTSQGVKPGDQVLAMWQIDEGTHYVLRGITKVDPQGQALGLVLLQAELRETYQQIGQLQDQVGQLHHQIGNLQQAIAELAKQSKPAAQ